MLQLHNDTPFNVDVFLFPDIEGVDTLHVVAKATFTIEGGATFVAAEQRSIDRADVYRGAPIESSLLRASEAHLEKPSTDVVLMGEAFAPRGKPAPEVDVTLSVGPVKKTVRVFGDRRWTGLLGDRISSPEPFERVPLVYERAFGGLLAVDPITNEAKRDVRNPAGPGLHALPNLEDPAALIARPSDTPAPACFGFVAPMWEPRKSRTGTCDAAWKSTRAPYLPLDFDPRFFHVAHPDLVSPARLSGGEPVEIRNASPSGLLRFELPRPALGAAIRLRGETHAPALHLETVLLEPGEASVSLTYRGGVRCDKRLPERIDVRVEPR